MYNFMEWAFLTLKLVKMMFCNKIKNKFLSDYSIVYIYMYIYIFFNTNPSHSFIIKYCQHTRLPEQVADR